MSVWKENALSWSDLKQTEKMCLPRLNTSSVLILRLAVSLWLPVCQWTWLPRPLMLHRDASKTSTSQWIEIVAESGRGKPEFRTRFVFLEQVSTNSNDEELQGV